MQRCPKAVWSIPYVSVAFLPSLKQTFIAYRSSKGSDRIFAIHQLWQSGFGRVYFNCCCSCWFEPEIMKIGQSSHKMSSNIILYLKESTTILNAHTKKSGNLSYAPRISEYNEFNYLKFDPFWVMHWAKLIFHLGYTFLCFLTFSNIVYCIIIASSILPRSPIYAVLLSIV